MLRLIFTSVLIVPPQLMCADASCLYACCRCTSTGFIVGSPRLAYFTCVGRPAAHLVCFTPSTHTLAVLLLTPSSKWNSALMRSKPRPSPRALTKACRRLPSDIRSLEALMWLLLCSLSARAPCRPDGANLDDTDALLRSCEVSTFTSFSMPSALTGQVSGVHAHLFEAPQSPEHAFLCICGRPRSIHRRPLQEPNSDNST